MVDLIIDYTDMAENKDTEEIIRKAVENTLIHHGLGFDAEVSVTITNNDEIQSINKEFRNIDAPTDVLSFPMHEFDKPAVFDEKALALEPAGVILGDIVVSVDKIAEQAEEFGHSFETELSYLVIHSTLHLLGYDHMEESDKRLMREQEEIIRKM